MTLCSLHVLKAECEHSFLTAVNLMTVLSGLITAN